MQNVDEADILTLLMVIYKCTYRKGVLCVYIGEIKYVILLHLIIQFPLVTVSSQTSFPTDRQFGQTPFCIVIPKIKCIGLEMKKMK